MTNLISDDSFDVYVNMKIEIYNTITTLINNLQKQQTNIRCGPLEDENCKQILDLYNLVDKIPQELGLKLIKYKNLAVNESTTLHQERNSIIKKALLKRLDELDEKYTTDTDNARKYFNELVMCDEIKLKELLTTINNLILNNNQDNKIIIFVGSSNNLLLEVIKKILCEKIACVSANSIALINAPRYHQYTTFIIHEFEDNYNLNMLEPYLNERYGSELFKASIVPGYKFIIECNKLPIIPQSMYNRVKIINFNREFNPIENNYTKIRDILNKYFNEVLSFLINI